MPFVSTAGDGGNGTATISTKGTFDREKQKYYHIPIVMWDMHGKNSNESKTGTNTLTVTIGDINDNKPRPGHQDIFVYNYKGESVLDISVWKAVFLIKKILLVNSSTK